jgi:hypothetical protein
MSEAIARYYDATKNPDQAFFPGIPLRDLTQDEWDALSDRMRESIDAAPFYRKTKPPAAPASPEE